MNVLIKILNKMNGNLCFAAESSSNYYIFECDRVAKSVSYSTSSKPIKDICLNTLNNYLVCFGDDQIGLFNGITLNETYSTCPSAFNLITYGKTISGNNNFYIWDKYGNSIHRIEMSGAITSNIWTFNLPWDFTSCQDAKIFYKKYSDLIIFKGMGKIFSIRDLDSSAVLVGNTAVDDNNFVTISGDNYPFVSYTRTRQVWGKELEISSSSSSSSSSSTSLSSSSSSSTSSSSSESSSVYHSYYCVTLVSTLLANGTYYKTDLYFTGYPVWYNGTYYLYRHTWLSTEEWCIDTIIANDNPTLVAYSDGTYDAPDISLWLDNVTYNEITVVEGVC